MSTGFLWGVIKFSKIDCVMVAQISSLYIVKHWVIHFKWVNCMVYRLYLNISVAERKGQRWPCNREIDTRQYLDVHMSMLPAYRNSSYYLSTSLCEGVSQWSHTRVRNHRLLWPWSRLTNGKEKSGKESYNNQRLQDKWTFLLNW